MIEFLQAHYQLIIVILIAIVEVIFFFLKKKPSLNLDDLVVNIINDAIPGYVNLAEASGSTGSEKLAFVVSHCLRRVKKMVSDIDEVYWTKIIIQKVEAVLSCPQKKENIV